MSAPTAQDQAAQQITAPLFNERRARVDLDIQQVDARPLVVVLKAVDEWAAFDRDAAAHGVTLQLSGHTHGGQIWPFGLFVRLAQPYVAGLANHHGTQIYVSRGTGFWGPPMRFGAPSELTHIELRAAMA